MLSLLFVLGAGKEAKPILVPPTPGPPVPTYSRAAEEMKAIELVKEASVQVIDSTLADTKFANWFRDVVGPNATISWAAEDCGWTERRHADLLIHHPLRCVRASADLGEGFRMHAVIGLVSPPKGGDKIPVFLNGGVIGPEDRKPTKVGFLADLEEWSRHHRGITGVPARR